MNKQNEPTLNVINEVGKCTKKISCYYCWYYIKLLGYLEQVL